MKLLSFLKFSTLLALVSCNVPQGTEVGNGKQPTQNPQGTKPDTTETSNPTPTFGHQIDDFEGLSPRFKRALQILFARCGSPFAENLQGSYLARLDGGGDPASLIFSVTAASGGKHKISFTNGKTREVVRKTASGYAIDVTSPTGIVAPDAFVCQTVNSTTVSTDTKRSMTISDGTATTVEWIGELDTNSVIDVQTITIDQASGEKLIIERH